ncbi:cytochrome B [Chromohalobacter salexigens]|uniref:Cytochrome b/b6 domain-containing protein n=2 Tax=Chromohalobacter TaxID=42054 RepID=A0A9X2X4H0_9GAMM|nr:MULTISPECIES: cytochrome b/b6 domain-containing protein [Chromohalobacter]NWO11794.1 cytochrome B [Chromohalobacter salexigens]MCK0769467.1 cytochrome b/b6 domain-containing protein [Chromohalobacter canadensis]MCK2042261.1 cytochrome b/b6 domain-containing protein [Chromohalobacter moromii]MCK2047202.1 cytochrome b/b6 domain-containing protein [Chromohalobacter moromii]MCT8468138.1 cytochrome b/b6 domain-containing protein [Chromohalobacter canadensis]
MAHREEHPQKLKIWDPIVRILHWTLAIAFMTAWVSSGQWQTLHEWAGYTVGVAIVLRIIWGIIGTRHARFINFTYSPKEIFQHLRNMRHGHERHYDGHNPAGSAMVFLLLGGLGLQAILGWLLTTHTFQENTLIETVHPILGNALLIAAILHVVGVTISSKLTKQNLAKAMLTGKKTKKRQE